MKLRRIFQMPMKTRSFSEGVTFDRIRTITFKNGGHCVRVLRCHQLAYAYSSARPQISEVGLLGSNLGRGECFASLMCIMCTCTMLQSVQGRGIHSATDGAMFYKEPFLFKNPVKRSI